MKGLLIAAIAACAVVLYFGVAAVPGDEAGSPPPVASGAPAVTAPDIDTATALVDQEAASDTAPRFSSAEEVMETDKEPADAAPFVFDDLSSQTYDAIAPHTEIQKVVSPLGIEAWLVEEYAVPLIAVEVGFVGGAREDPIGKEGLARMASALIDEGAGDLSSQDFQKKLEDLAVRMRFTAGRDAVYGSVRMLADRKGEAMDMFRLAMTAPRFDNEPVTRIRQQLLASLRRDSSDPDTIAQESWFSAVLGDHPYARPVKGTPDSLSTINAEDLRGLVSRMFARDNLKIAVVGAISADELAALLDKTFGDLPETSTRADVPEVDSLQAPGQVLVFERDQPQSVAVFGREGLKIEDPDFIPAFVMNYILGGGGFSSRLMEEVREKKGLAYGIYSYLLPLDYGAFYYGSVGTENARIAETIDIIKSEFAKMCDDGVSEKELADAKTYLTGSFPLRFDSNSSIANQLVGFQLSNRGIDYINERNGLIDAVTVEDIARVAQRLLQPDDLTFAVVGKPKGIEPDRVVPVP